MAISREQVFAVADELQANGQKPTLEAIRQRLGGSYTTLAPLLREWKAAQVAADVPMSEPLPESIVARMEDVGREVWKSALELANSRLQAEREALEKERGEIERERDEAMTLADSLREERDAGRSEIERLNAEIAALRERAQADALQIAELRGRLAALEPLLPLLDELKSRMAVAHET